MRAHFRIFFILPVVFFGLIAITQLFLNGFFEFSLWFFATSLVLMVCLPIVFPSMEERFIPIYDIFAILLAFTFLAGISIFFTLRPYLPFDVSLAISIFLGPIITAIILFLRNKG